MAAAYIQVPPDSSGQKSQGFNNVVGNTAVVATAVAVVTSSGVSCDPPSGNGVAVAGTVNSNAADSGSPVKVGGVYNSSLPTAASGNRLDIQLDVNGRQLMATSADGTVAAGTAATKSFLVGGVYNTALPAPTNGQQVALQLDACGRAFVTATGNVASNAADSGNPVKVGGVYNSTLPVVPNGGRCDIQLDASGFQRVAGAITATVISSASAVGAVMTATPGEWSITHSPAANTQATISKAAGGAGVRHVCRQVSGTIGQDATGSTAVLVTLNLRDGATGAGTVLQSWTMCLANTAGAVVPFSFPGLNIFGTANTALTIEFNASGGVHVFQSVNASGFSVS